jgi:tRNA(His) guanylyltransferase
VSTDSLGDRMKEYESVPQTRLIRRMPAILRLDGRAFHTLTKDLDKPFDQALHSVMTYTTSALYSEVQTCVYAYCQSDEISLLLKDYTKLETQSWFGGNIQKICSIAASIATMNFNKHRLDFGQRHKRLLDCGNGMFDARVFNLPKEDVVNYFIWRQKDAIRNSVNALGQAYFSHNQLQGKSQSEVLAMLGEIDIDWYKTVDPEYQRGFSVYKSGPARFMGVDVEYAIGANLRIPIFTENREHISQFLEEGDIIGKRA